ncbi:MAG TPA: hypothetical protein VJA22_03365 [Patescibacteria group bacterium]|nr:hypothetical protein [Patescibacteria group bacterium]
MKILIWIAGIIAVLAIIVSLILYISAVRGNNASEEPADGNNVESAE